MTEREWEERATRFYGCSFGFRRMVLGKSVCGQLTKASQESPGEVCKATDQEAQGFPGGSRDEIRQQMATAFDAIILSGGCA